MGKGNRGKLADVAGEGTKKDGEGGEGNGESSDDDCEFFVHVKLQGTVICAPRDGMERRFTSFFSKVILQLDNEAFPEDAAVEVRGKSFIFYQ